MSIEIPLRNRAGEVVAHTLIDEEDASAADVRWYRSPHGYAMRGTWYDGKKSVEYLHRVITKAPRGTEVDHLNHDTLDNRRANLRVTDKSGNMQNRGPWRKRTLPLNVYKRPWGTYRVVVNRKHLGEFHTVEEAVAVAKAWRAKHMPMSAEAAERTAS